MSGMDLVRVDIQRKMPVGVLGVELLSQHAGFLDDIDGVFDTAVGWGANAVVVSGSTFQLAYRDRFLTDAAARHLTALYLSRLTIRRGRRFDLLWPRPRPNFPVRATSSTRSLRGARPPDPPGEPPRSSDVLNAPDGPGARHRRPRGRRRPGHRVDRIALRSGYQHRL